MFVSLFAAASLLIQPTHSLEQDEKLFNDERPKLERLVEAMKACGTLPDIHLPFMAVYGNQTCPNGGAVAAEVITNLVADAHIVDADKKRITFLAKAAPVSAIMLRTGANGLGFQLGSSSSVIWYFPDGLPRQYATELKALEPAHDHWYQQVMTNDVEDH